MARMYDGEVKQIMEKFDLDGNQNITKREWMAVFDGIVREGTTISRMLWANTMGSTTIFDAARKANFGNLGRGEWEQIFRRADPEEDQGIPVDRFFTILQVADSSDLPAGLGGCHAIPRTEHRGIFPSDLDRLHEHIKRRCPSEKWSTNFGGELVTKKAKTVNLYDVATFVIRPLTALCAMSFVEFISLPTDVRTPRFFASHWWGEAVQDFIACLHKHTKTRQKMDMEDEEWPYWVCAYANNQAELGNEISVDPKETSFFRAMELCEGVVLILDPKATPLTRVWCLFEASTVVLKEGDPLLFDIATIAGMGVQILTEGLVDKDRGSYVLKAAREARFPFKVLEGSLSIDVSQGQASVSADRDNILKSIRGAEDSEMNIEATNIMLRGMYGIATWRVACKNDKAAFAMRAIAADTTRTRLALPCYGSLDADISVLAPVFTLTALETLSLDLSFNGLGSNALDVLRDLENLQKLQDLELEFAWNSFTDGIEPLACVGGLRALRKLLLNLNECKLTSVSPLRSIGDLVDLEDLDLTMKINELGEGLEDLLACFGDLQGLRRLRLNLAATHLTSIDPLFNIRKLSNLQELELVLSENDLQKGIEPLACIGELQELRRLSLTGRDCKLTTLSPLRSVGQLAHLQDLTIDFEKNSLQEGIEDLTCIGELQDLRKLFLRLPDCKLIDIAPLSSIGKLVNLTDLYFNTSRNDLQEGIEALTSLEELRSLTKLRLFLGESSLTEISPLLSVGKLGDLQAIQIDLRKNPGLDKELQHDWLSFDGLKKAHAESV